MDQAESQVHPSQELVERLQVLYPNGAGDTQELSIVVADSISWESQPEAIDPDWTPHTCGSIVIGLRLIF